MERKIYFTMIIVLCSWLSLSSCTFNPASSNNDLTGSAAGTVAGAGIGAGTMALFKASPAFIVAGGIAGGSIGYYVTSLRFASGGVMYSGGQVFTLGDFTTIEIPTDRLFDTNTSELLPEAQPILDSAISVLNRSPSTNVLISGNTSGFGSSKYEQKLSEDRAREVAAYLWANGINGFQEQSLKLRKLIYVGYGNFFPVANHQHSHSIRQNSRIQISAYPTNAQLHLTKRCKIFQNIGASDNPSLAPQESSYDLNREFPTTLSDRDNHLRNYTPPEQRFIRENDNLKGESTENFNTVEGQMSPPKAAATDFKNEGGFGLKGG